MIVFKFKKCSLTFNFSFFASLALILLLKDERVVLMGVGACLIHECGHIIAMISVKEPTSEIVFSGIGIKIRKVKPPLRRFKTDLFVLSAGIATNIIISVIILISRLPYLVFAQVNITIAVFNLLPFEIFDGGQIRELLIYRFFEYENASKLLRVLRKFDFILILVSFVALILIGNRNPWLYITLLVFIVINNFDG
jgi:Zn-dependent protease